MKLHTIETLFHDAVTATGQRFDMPEIYVEKDYWVTVALHAIFHSAIADDAVFKGGKALSKCHKIIQRFSEDLDIVIKQKEDESGNERRRRLRAITSVVNEIMPEVEIAGITNKKGMIRKTAHQYAKQSFAGIYGQVREQIIVEASWIGSTEPFIYSKVSCYITDMMVATNQKELIEQFEMQPFVVKVLSLERTLCEKIMSLVRFSHSEQPYTDLANKIRHIYDLHLLLKNEAVAEFFSSKAFDQLLLTVGNDDVQGYKNNNKWLQYPPSDAIIFANPEGTWDKIKNAYRTTFKELVTGELPAENDLINTLKKIYQRLYDVDWQL